MSKINAASQAPQPELQVPAAMSALGTALASLNDTVRELGGRLAPITSPTPVKGETGSDSSSVDLARAIQTYAAVAWSIQAEAQSLLDGLQI